MSAIRAAAPPEGRQVLDPEAIARAVRRMAHEIVERNQGTKDVVLVGLVKGGVWLAKAVHMVVPPRLTRGDWESFWASLTFEMP